MDHQWKTDTVWLNTAQSGVPPTSAHTALTHAIDAWHTGTAPIEDWSASVQTTRTRFAHLVNAPTTDITLGASASQLFATLASSLPDHAHVLVPEGEFTSAVFPFHAQHDRGVTVTTAPLHALADHIGPHTTAVAYSPVQSPDGRLAPTDRILAAARTHRTLVFADATQAAGWYPLQATDFDALICSAYKWLMAPRGLAMAYLSPALRSGLRPIHAGPIAAADPTRAFYADHFDPAPDARALDLSPNWLAAVAAAPALDALLQVGVEHIHAHNTALADRFRAHLDLPPGHSAITAVDIPDALRTLQRAGIKATERGGRTRLAFHLYNTEADADLAAKALTG
ncbi:aminotransferase class V-fold PLP-dependent enzyme [Nocardiopsis sp. MG754419]|uniref:aminotransferase class V-fold PLP-dependent enzyme n=1 Tax=Nocardiopsis sp. MG754419 TaxID=2259865 RepID=UPI001BAB2662|nr:aminotransferase class V-fold PLP-dependent enzyme [Nocardiopsis sp. MG754419]MBR8744786.1 aminotransferase [Nocardiopsis sp. MG754419]